MREPIVHAVERALDRATRALGVGRRVTIEGSHRSDATPVESVPLVAAGGS